MAQVRGDSPNDDGVIGTTRVTGKSGVFGFNPTAGGNGVAGISENGNGVFARSKSLNGIFGESETGAGVHGHSFSQSGVFGVSDKGDGIVAVAKSPTKSGVFGSNESTGEATAPGGSGVFGLTLAAKAVGVFGANNNPTSGRGIQGNGAEAGVGGFSETGSGVIGQSNQGDGVQGFTVSSDRNGILGRNSSTDRAPTDGPPSGNGVFGFTDVPNASGVCGAVGPDNTEGAGVTGIGKIAGRFIGDVEVTGDIRIANADCAEDFDIAQTENVEPGMVMVIDRDGVLQASRQAYDRRVAGVISGAGNFRPGIILDKQESQDDRVPVALLGKVYCKVDAQYSSIEVGDLLTTSPTRGHAMKAYDPIRAFGAVIGKALRPLREGQALIPILIALQ